MILLVVGAFQCPAAELRVSQEALERTLKQQLFSGPAGSILKGSAQSARSVNADDAQVTFTEDQIVVKVKTKARMGKSTG